MTIPSSAALLVLVGSALVSAEVILTYPGWRGNNLITNATFPFGMQPMFPCGGISLTLNRTYWPTTGGAIAFHPAFRTGRTALQMFVNLGFGDKGPDNGPSELNHVLVPQFGIQGPANSAPFSSAVCLQNVAVPKEAPAVAGSAATIQLVEIGLDGVARYSCADITFADPGDARIPKVDTSNCFNSSDVAFADVTVTSPTGGTLNGSPASPSSGSGMGTGAIAGIVIGSLVFLSVAVALVYYVAWRRGRKVGLRTAGAASLDVIGPKELHGQSKAPAELGGSARHELAGDLAADRN